VKSNCLPLREIFGKPVAISGITWPPAACYLTG
jgi:hypothetical protein